MTVIEDFYTLGKAAEKLEVNERYVRDQISDGKLVAHKRGSRWYILHSDLVAFVSAGKTKDDAKTPKPTEG